MFCEIGQKALVSIGGGQEGTPLHILVWNYIRSWLPCTTSASCSEGTIAWWWDYSPFQFAFVRCNELLTSISALQLFLSRIALTLCCVCSRSSCGIQQFTQIAFSLLEIQSSCSMLHSLGLDMLTMAPAEVEALDVSRTLRLELQEHLQHILPQVLQLINRIAVANESESQVVEAIKLLVSWLQQGVTLSGLFEEHRCIFNMLWLCLQSRNEASVVQCCSLIKDIVSLSEFPRTAARDQAVSEIVRIVTLSGPALAPFFAVDGSSDSAAHEICSCITSLVCNETAHLSGPESCNIDFFSLLLSCVAQRSRKIASLTFDAWLSLQDVAVIARHPFLQSQIYYSLLTILLTHCKYRDGFVGWDLEIDDDEDDFSAYRDQRQGLQEVLVACFYALQVDFYRALQNEVMSADSWQCLEAVLYVLYSIMDSAKGLISSSSSSSDSVPILLLHEVANRVISMDPGKVPIFILESACKFLGSITFFIVGSQTIAGTAGSTLFFPALQFLFSIHSTDLSAHSRSKTIRDSVEIVASKSIHQLCVKGSHFFSAPTSCQSPHHRPPSDPHAAYHRIVSLIELTAQIVATRSECVSLIPSTLGEPSSSLSPSPSLMLLIEASTRTITVADLDNDSARNLVSILASPIVIGLKYELEHSAPKRQKVEVLLCVATQIIKFSDQTNISQGPLIGDFLSILWPLLNRISCHPILGVTVTVTNEVFNLFRSSILSARSLVLPEICNIATAVVSYLNTSLSAATTRESLESSPLSANSNSNAIQCAASMVEALAGRSDGLQMLSSLLEQITESVFGALQCDFQHLKSGHSTTLWRISDDSVDKYFSYVYLYVLMCPEVLSDMIPTVRKIVYALRMSLSLYKERGVLRAALHVLQSLFSPTTSKLIPYHSLLVQIAAEMGEDIVNLVLRSLCGEVQSSLCPNFVESLLCILSGSEEHYPDRARSWVYSAMSDVTIASLQVVRPQDKQLVLSAMIRLVTSDRRRCKALLMDFSKLCRLESTPDCLLAYEMWSCRSCCEYHGCEVQRWNR